MAERSGPEIKAAAVRVEGRVQGVAYRAWTESRAQRLGLDGWVRNNPDGSVSALFVGPPANVDAMIQACSDGPSAARVDQVTDSDGAAEASRLAGSGFSILR